MGGGQADRCAGPGGRQAQDEAIRLNLKTIGEDVRPRFGPRGLLGSIQQAQI